MRIPNRQLVIYNFNMGLTLNVNYKKDDAEVFEFIVKGDESENLPKLEKYLASWRSKYPDTGQSEIVRERGYLVAKIQTRNTDLGKEFVSFLGSSFEAQPSFVAPENLKYSIDLGLCQLQTLEGDKATIQIQNPNRILRNLNQAVSQIWPGLVVKYTPTRYPLYLRVLPDPLLLAEEFSCNLEETTEIRFHYNPKILTFSRGVEKALEFVFAWLNHQMLTAVLDGDPPNLERNWPHDPEFQYIRWFLSDQGRRIFESMSPSEIDADPLEFCLKILRADPFLSLYFSEEVFRRILDKYPGVSPFLERAKKIKSNLEADQRAKNISDLESDPPVEGSIPI